MGLNPGHIGDLERFKAEIARIVAESRALKPLPGLETAGECGQGGEGQNHVAQGPAKNDQDGITQDRIS